MDFFEWIVSLMTQTVGGKIITVALFVPVCYAVYDFIREVTKNHV